MSVKRENDVKFAVKLITKGFKIKQYNRLINNKLFPEEDRNELIKTLMEYFIETEEYEKCAIIKKLANECNLLDNNNV